jgi:protein-tyrosine phosphatase
VPVTETTTRWLAVEGSSNVRDLGGVPLAGGGTTAFGVAYRSDTLQEHTDADVARFRERGVALVLDLRTPTEARQEGRGPLVESGSVRYVNAPLLPDSAFNGTADDDVVVHDRTREERVRHYLGYLHDSGGVEMVRAVTELARAESAAIFHCAAGKDRTGVLAAMVLDVAGADREAVVADYALTTERIDGIMGRLGRLQSYAEDIAEVPRELHVAEAGTMRDLMAAIDSRYGGARTWLAAAGVAEADLDRLAARLRG